MTHSVAAKMVGTTYLEEEIEIYSHNTEDNESDNKYHTDGCSLGIPSVKNEAESQRIVCPPLTDVGPDYAWALRIGSLFISSHSRNV